MTNQPDEEKAAQPKDEKDNAFFQKNELDSEWQKKHDRVRNRQKRRKILKYVFLILACFILAVLLTFFILRAVGKSQLLNTNIKIDPNSASDTIVYDDNTILYKDVLYRYNDNITAVLCLGIDRQQLSDVEIYGKGGQADAIFLVTVDTQTGKTNVTAIPRDAMTDIELYSASGSYIGTEKKQLCISYAYGDGRETSCEASVRAVSRFLYGMPINSYFAIDVSAVGRLNDAVGGVPVTPNETIIAEDKVQYINGVKTMLYGSHALPYLRCRNRETVDSSYLRMKRQTEYLSNYSALAVEKTKSNLSFPITLFNMVNDESVTNLNVSRVTYLTTAMFTNRNDVSVKFHSIVGEQTLGNDEHAEFYADNEKLLELVLELFYYPI